MKESQKKRKWKTQKRVMKNKKGVWVEPTLIFKGCGSEPYSPRMKELRNRYNEIREKYTIVITE